MGITTATVGDEPSPTVVPCSDGARWRSWLGGRLDHAGIVWSALCAAHCAAPLAVLGVAVVTGTAHELGHHAHRHAGSHVQLALAITSVVLSGFLLGRSYVFRHRDWRPLGIFGVAVVALAVGGSIPSLRDTTGLVVNAAGFTGLVVAQIANSALVRRRSGCCAQRRCAC